jgi:hypothetical protein
VVQARTLCWLALLIEAHDEQASDAERRGDVEQAMGWFADAMRLRDVIQVLTSIEIPLPAQADGSERDDPLDDLQDRGGPLAAGGLRLSAAGVKPCCRRSLNQAVARATHGIRSPQPAGRPHRSEPLKESGN